MKWNRWSKLVTNARTQDTGVVVGEEIEWGRAAFDYERGVAK